MEEGMKRYSYFALCTLAGISLAGCMTPQGHPDYTASGALAGAATGAIIGNMGHHRGPAGLAGAAMGAVVGGIIGSGMDDAQAAQLRAQSPQTMRRVEESQPLTPADIISLVQAGIGDDLIIKQIGNSRTIFRLKSAEIIELKQAGVSEAVIDCMIDTLAEFQADEENTTETVVRQQVIIAPGPDFIWVGGRWLWHDDGWVWHDGHWRRPLHPQGRHPAY